MEFRSRTSFSHSLFQSVGRKNHYVFTVDPKIVRVMGDIPRKGRKRGPKAMPDPTLLAPQPPSTLATRSSHLDYIESASLDFLDQLHPLQAALQSPKPGSKLLLPVVGFVHLPPRFSNVQEKDFTLAVIQRQSFIDLNSFIEEKAITYVHGPQGFGKSFALYHLFCALSTSPLHRVLYVPDCSMLNGAGSVCLFEALIAAFARDEQLLADLRPYASVRKEHDWAEIEHLIVTHCDNYQLEGLATPLTFIAIFDQHNALLLESRKHWPCNIFLSNGLARNHNNYKVVISASATNDEDQPLFKDIAMFPYLSGLSDLELQAWREHFQFFPNEDFKVLCEMTANNPYELFRAYQTWKESRCSLAFPAVVQAYHDARLGCIQESHSRYLAKRQSGIEYNKTELRIHGK